MTRYFSWVLLAVLFLFALWLYLSNNDSKHTVFLNSDDVRYSSDLPDAVVEEVSTYASRFLGVSEEGLLFQSGRWGESFWAAFYYQNTHPISDEIDINEVVDGEICDSYIRKVMTSHMVTEFYFVINSVDEIVSVLKCSQRYKVR